MDNELRRDPSVLAPAETIARHPEIWDDLDDSEIDLILDSDWSLFARPEQSGLSGRVVDFSPVGNT